MNYHISQRAASLAPSMTLVIDSKAKQLKAAGQDVVGFGAGEPDFDTPPHIVEAAAKALHDGQTHYCPAPGLPILRETCANHLSQHRGIDVLTAASPLGSALIGATEGDVVTYKAPSGRDLSVRVVKVEHTE